MEYNIISFVPLVVRVSLLYSLITIKNFSNNHQTKVIPLKQTIIEPLMWLFLFYFVFLKSLILPLSQKC